MKGRDQTLRLHHLRPLDLNSHEVRANLDISPNSILRRGAYILGKIKPGLSKLDTSKSGDDDSTVEY